MGKFVRKDDKLSSLCHYTNSLRIMQIAENYYHLDMCVYISVGSNITFFKANGSGEKKISGFFCKSPNDRIYVHQEKASFTSKREQRSH